MSAESSKYFTMPFVNFVSHDGETKTYMPNDLLPFDESNAILGATLDVPNHLLTIQEGTGGARGIPAHQQPNDSVGSFGLATLALVAVRRVDGNSRLLAIRRSKTFPHSRE